VNVAADTMRCALGVTDDQLSKQMSDQLTGRAGSQTAQTIKFNFRSPRRRRAASALYMAGVIYESAQNSPRWDVSRRDKVRS
jgi:hypothetical protein